MAMTEPIDVPVAGPVLRFRDPPCKDLTALFFPDLHERSDEAEARRMRASRICLEVCPYTVACRTWAEERRERWGIWGGVDFGLSVTERRKQRATHLRSMKL